jgi:hypothetical protein
MANQPEISRVAPIVESNGIVAMNQSRNVHRQRAKQGMLNKDVGTPGISKLGQLCDQSPKAVAATTMSASCDVVPQRTLALS